MLQGIIGKIASALFASIMAKIDEWMTRKQLEAAESKAKALESHARSMDEADATEAEMEAVVEEIDAVYKEGATYKAKLHILRREAENRRMKKIKEKIS